MSFDLHRSLSVGRQRVGRWVTMTGHVLKTVSMLHSQRLLIAADLFFLSRSSLTPNKSWDAKISFHPINLSKSFTKSLITRTSSRWSFLRSFNQFKLQNPLMKQIFLSRQDTQSVRAVFGLSRRDRSRALVVHDARLSCRSLLMQVSNIDWWFRLRDDHILEDIAALSLNRMPDDDTCFANESRK